MGQKQRIRVTHTVAAGPGGTVRWAWAGPGRAEGAGAGPHPGKDQRSRQRRPDATPPTLAVATRALQQRTEHTTHARHLHD